MLPGLVSSTFHNEEVVQKHRIMSFVRVVEGNWHRRAVRIISVITRHGMGTLLPEHQDPCSRGTSVLRMTRLFRIKQTKRIVHRPFRGRMEDHDVAARWTSRKGCPAQCVIMVELEERSMGKVLTVVSEEGSRVSI